MTSRPTAMPCCTRRSPECASGDRKRGEAGRSGSPPSGRGDRKRGEAGRSGSPPSGRGDRKRGEAGRSGSPPWPRRSQARRSRAQRVAAIRPRRSQAAGEAGRSGRRGPRQNTETSVWPSKKRTSASAARSTTIHPHSRLCGGPCGTRCAGRATTTPNIQPGAAYTKDSKPSSSTNST